MFGRRKNFSIGGVEGRAPGATQEENWGSIGEYTGPAVAPTSYKAPDIGEVPAGLAAPKAVNYDEW